MPGLLMPAAPLASSSLSLSPAVPATSASALGSQSNRAAVSSAAQPDEQCGPSVAVVVLQLVTPKGSVRKKQEKVKWPIRR